MLAVAKIAITDDPWALPEKDGGCHCPSLPQRARTEPSITFPRVYKPAPCRHPRLDETTCRRTKLRSLAGSPRRKRPWWRCWREVVNIDSGSYDKAGVDAVGRRLIAFFAEQGLVTATEPHERFGEAIHVRLDDTRSNEKPIVLMGHRDTVFPQGRGGSSSLPHRQRTRLWSGRGRHEGRPRHQCVRAGGLQALRWRACPTCRPDHKR